MILTKLIKPLKDKRRTGNIFSRPFRLIFNQQKTTKLQGAFLVFLLLVSGFFNQTKPVFGQNQELMVQEEIDQPIITQLAFIKPVGGVISQRYHWGHKAIDLAGNKDEDIHPVAKGRVVEVAYLRWGYGNKVVIEHENGFKSLYAHLSKIYVKLGDEVGQEAVIGTVGSTGWSTGPHLHFELWQNEKPLDPQTIF